MRTSAKQIAFGGVFAALAVVIMSLGGLIPIATYVCPMICALILHIVLISCGERIAWAWYAAVAVLVSLVCADKEAAAVFVFLGYYPILKPKIDKMRMGKPIKFFLFNAAAAIMYAVLIFLLGMDSLLEEFSQAGSVLLIGMLLLANVTFFLLDRVLERLKVGKR